MADRYLLESGSPDGYLLEDSSGVLSLEPPVPVVTFFETPNWSALTGTRAITVTGAVAGDKLIACMGGDRFSTAITATGASTTAGPGTTGSWSHVEQQLGTTNTGFAAIEQADVTGDGTLTVTLSRTQAGNVSSWGGFVILVHNNGGTGVHTQIGPASTADVVSLTVAEGSVVVLVATDWDDLSPTAFTPAGATEIQRAAGADVANYGAYWTGQAAGTRNYGVATNSSNTMTMMAVEVLAPSTNTDANITPGSVNAVASVPTATVQADSTVTPGTVNAVASVPTATVRLGVAIAPPAVTATASVPTATVSTGSTVTRPSVAAVAAVPAPSVQAGATVAPATVTATASIPALTVQAGGSLVQPASVIAVAAVPAPSVQAGSKVTPSTVTATASVPTATIAAGSKVTPASVNAVAAIPAPTVSAGANEIGRAHV